ncbi:MAG TPA: antibiotic biosynthesis monooxygenase [Bacteroidetes bacterium]|nr:antibiotic biosynthesis monooxygenase [Bacteroidota bacterium]
MIVRIVKMEFRPECVGDFRALFNRSKDKIAAFDGCLHLELLQEAGAHDVIFTYSIWRDEAALNKYRFSELFKAIWSETRSYFSGGAEAWSLESLEQVKVHERVRSH